MGASKKTKLERLIEKTHNITPLVWFIAIAAVIVFLNQLSESGLALWNRARQLAGQAPNAVAAPAVTGADAPDFSPPCVYILVERLPVNDSARAADTRATFQFENFLESTDPLAAVTLVILKGFDAYGIHRLDFEVRARIADDVEESAAYAAFLSLRESNLLRIEVPAPKWSNQLEPDEIVEASASAITASEALAMIGNTLVVPRCYTLNAGVKFVSSKGLSGR